MSGATWTGLHAYMTMYLLFGTGCITQKVHFDCGAKVDAADGRGLILSPGFPYNYSSGIHCVWQLFVPAGQQLVLEVFHFDVFESDEPGAASYPQEETTAGGRTPGLRRPGSGDRGGGEAPLAQALIGESERAFPSGTRAFPSGTRASRGADAQDRTLQGEQMKMEVDRAPQKASDRAPRLQRPDAQPPGGEAPDSSSSSSTLPPPTPEGPRPSPRPDPTSTAAAVPPGTPTSSPETPQTLLDACPHDVLYISDLLTFSSRFCGARRPPGGQLVFGSSREMVEVIMELITTTHWGRGFALLFHYRNLTEPGGGDGGRSHARASARADAVLAAVSGAVFFVVVLVGILCLILRPKLCPKRSNICVSSGSEVPEAAGHAATEVSELREVAADEGAERGSSGEQLAERPSPPRRDHRAQAVGTGGEAPQDLDQDLELSPGGLMELDLGADEVFITPSDVTHPGMPLSDHKRGRYQRRSAAGPGTLNPPTPTGSGTSRGPMPPSRPEGGSGGPRARPRAWSVRTFQDFLPPVPQLHRKWCSWNSTSPFTKLVDTTPPNPGAAGPGAGGRRVFSEAGVSDQPAAAAADSASSSASYPLTQAAGRQRRLNSASNLRRSLFTGAGLLSAGGDPSRAASTPGPTSSSGQPPHAGKRRVELAAEESAHVSVPVFAISEEEDREPLVPAEHLAQTSFSSSSSSSAPSMVNGQEGGVSLQRRPPPPLC